MPAVLCMGCAAPSPQSTDSLLTQADAKMAAEDYGGAQALYGEFVTANPDDTQAGRARAVRTALDRLLSSQAELNRVQRGEELVRLRRELSDRQSEVDRLKAEVTKLRADLERLRNIDLKK
jgi:multidrug resistance efflux pump